MTKKLITALFIALSCSSLSGCAAVAIGAYVYSDTEDDKLKQAFLKEFDAKNFEREKAGLAPLNLCDALKRRDKSWYADDPVCNPKK